MRVTIVCTPFSKKGELDRISIFRGSSWENQGDLFQGVRGCSLYIKNKLKFEIFNDKKVHKQKYFSLS